MPLLEVCLKHEAITALGRFDARDNMTPALWHWTMKAAARESKSVHSPSTTYPQVAPSINVIDTRVNQSEPPAVYTFSN